VQPAKRPWRLSTALYTALLATAAFGIGTGTVSAQDQNQQGNQDQQGGDQANRFGTESPVKHVIILIGENRGLDHTFGVYQPKGHGQTIDNILSKGIVDENGQPGRNFGRAQQFFVDPQATFYFGAPDSAKHPYGRAMVMPQPNTNGAPQSVSTNPLTDANPPFAPAALAEIGGEPDLEARDQPFLSTGATGLPPAVLDTRVAHAGQLPPGPFVLQNGTVLTDDDYTGDMTHRFYSAAQQQDCNIRNATRENPAGCTLDLFPFVMATFKPTDHSQGNEMGFYNAEQGQAALLKELADRFTLSDNFHQSVLGGTGANHVMFGHADAIFWSDGNGNPATPPGSAIANPNPVAGTVNQYTVDGNFTNCSDPTQPGIAPIVNYLRELPYRARPNCQQGAFYMINNVNPGFLPNGALANAEGGIPPSAVRSIGDALNEHNISWAYYGGEYNNAVVLSNAAVAANPANPELTTGLAVLAAQGNFANALGVSYCQICNPFQFDTSIMADAAVRTAHIKDTADLVDAIKGGTLPAVAIGKPDGLLDGHPQTSKIDLFEGYVRNLLDALDANPHLKAETAVFITWDEAGGYWDSGFVQPLDFMGDGTRIPLLILSPWTTGGMVNHAYADHVSLIKFIERNWSLQPLTQRSRDNLPNPRQTGENPYVPQNMPAIDDLFGAFDFHGKPNVQPFTVD
jgi:phospholipase C